VGDGAMKILYGVNGEGMGHAARSEVVIGSLLGELRADDAHAARVRGQHPHD